MNVTADALATTGLNNGVPKERVPLDPAVMIQLHVDGKTITRSLKHTVREMINTITLRDYYCRRFGWTKKHFDLIDWEHIFTPVYNRHAKKRLNWINKFTTKNLPTGERMQRRGSYKVEQCCSCKQTLETDDHLFQCPVRPQFHRKIYGALKKIKKVLDPTLFYILKSSIKNYLENLTDSFHHS